MLFVDSSFRLKNTLLSWYSFGMSNYSNLTVSIVTYYSDIATLQQVLASLGQCAVPVKIVIVDNTNDPEYFARLSNLGGVQCIRSPRNGGYGYGHNLALSTCGDAPYHLILNPDVMIHAGCIETLIEKMEQQHDIVLATPKTLDVSGALQHLNKRDPTVLDLVLRRLPQKYMQRVPMAEKRMARYMMMDVGYNGACDVPFASGCFMLFRRSALDALHGFDEQFFMYFEDADISRRARKIGRVQFVPEAVITHKWQGGSRTSWKLTLAIVKSAFQYFQKWGWRWW